ncbi:MAG: DUF6261 family protein [Prevotellaceae bacterium]|jgi:hypothetical protein|nr:DUF6261 family protein [Prevotellaceae bacterium]
MAKFITLKAQNLRLNDLGGLVSETINLSTPQIAIIGVVAAAKLQSLTTLNTTFHALMNKQFASLLTPPIQECDRKCGSLFIEIKRTSKAGRKSSLPAVAAAGNRMINFLEPFWTLNKEPLLSQTDQINLLKERYSATTSLEADATTLGIKTQIESLFTVNEELAGLYSERASQLAPLEGPSASSIKNKVVKAYNDYCMAIEAILSVLSTESLQQLFDEMNGIRRKYISRLPKPLNGRHTSTAPIADQPYTGRHLTPLPRVFYQTESALHELVFAQDFDVTYRNNVEVGEAKLFIHGKGKYTGAYSTTFHIVRAE